MRETKNERPHILLGVDLEGNRDLVVGSFAESGRVRSNMDSFLDVRLSYLSRPY